MAKKRFPIWRMELLHPAIMTLISPGDCTPQCGMWLWNHDSEFTKWQHSAVWYLALGWHAVELARWQHFAMWQVAPGWHAMEFAQTSAILEFYHITAVDMPFCTSLRNFYPNRTTLDISRKKWRHVDFQDGGSQPSWNLGVQWWDRWKAHVRHVVNRDHSFNLLRFWKKSRFCNLATDRQTNKQTDKQMVTPVAWSRSRCRERRLKNLTAVINMT